MTTNVLRILQLCGLLPFPACCPRWSQCPRTLETGHVPLLPLLQRRVVKATSVQAASQLIAASPAFVLLLIRNGVPSRVSERCRVSAGASGDVATEEYKRSAIAREMLFDLRTTSSCTPLRLCIQLYTFTAMHVARMLR